MNNLAKALDAAITTIDAHPQFTKNIKEAYELMLNEINDGESEENEIDHFYSYMVGLTS